MCREKRPKSLKIQMNLIFTCVKFFSIQLLLFSFAISLGNSKALYCKFLKYSGCYVEVVFGWESVVNIHHTFILLLTSFSTVRLLILRIFLCSLYYYIIPLCLNKKCGLIAVRTWFKKQFWILKDLVFSLLNFILMHAFIWVNDQSEICYR